MALCFPLILMAWCLIMPYYCRSVHAPNVTASQQANSVTFPETILSIWKNVLKYNVKMKIHVLYPSPNFSSTISFSFENIFFATNLLGLIKN